MADDLLDNYNPLYDVHLQQYFASPHMQKHLRRIGLLGNRNEYDGRDENDVYNQHNVTMDLLLKNREKQLAKLATLQKKLDAAEKVEICRKIRSGQTPGTTQPRSRPSRSLSRGPKAATRNGRRSSTSTDDKDLIKRIESEGEETPRANATVYSRLSASVGKYRYLHKLDDYTLSAYMEELRKQLRRLERFRDVSFGPHSVARHPSEPQESWFFRRRSSSKPRSSRSTSKKRNEPVRVQKLKITPNEAKPSTSLEIVGTSAITTKEKRKPVEIMKKKLPKAETTGAKEFSTRDKQTELKYPDSSIENYEIRKIIRKHVEETKPSEKPIEQERLENKAEDSSSNLTKIDMKNQENEPYITINEVNDSNMDAGTSATLDTIVDVNVAEKTGPYSQLRQKQEEEFIHNEKPHSNEESEKLNDQMVDKANPENDGPDLSRNIYSSNIYENIEEIADKVSAIAPEKEIVINSEIPSNASSTVPVKNETDESKGIEHSLMQNDEKIDKIKLISLGSGQEVNTAESSEDQTMKELDDLGIEKDQTADKIQTVSGLEDEAVEKTSQINETAEDQDTEALNLTNELAQSTIDNDKINNLNSNLENVSEILDALISDDSHEEIPETITEILSNEFKSDTCSKSAAEEVEALPNELTAEKTVQPSEWSTEQQHPNAADGEEKLLLLEKSSQDYNLPSKDDNFEESPVSAQVIASVEEKAEEEIKSNEQVPNLVDFETNLSVCDVVDAIKGEMDQDEAASDKTIENIEIHSPNEESVSETLNAAIDNITMSEAFVNTDSVSPKTTESSEPKRDDNELLEGLKDEREKAVENLEPNQANKNAFEDGNNEKLNSLSQKKAVIEDYKGEYDQENSDNTSTDTEGADAVLSDYEETERPTSPRYYNEQESSDLTSGGLKERNVFVMEKVVDSNSFLESTNEEESLRSQENTNQTVIPESDNGYQTQNSERDLFEASNEAETSDDNDAADQMMSINNAAKESANLVDIGEAEHQETAETTEDTLQNPDVSQSLNERNENTVDYPVQSLSSTSPFSTEHTDPETKHILEDVTINKATEDSENNNYSDSAKELSDDVLEKNSPAVNAEESFPSDICNESRSTTEVIETIVNESIDKVSNNESITGVQEDLQNNNRGNYFLAEESDNDTEQEVTVNQVYDEKERFLYNESRLITPSNDSFPDDEVTRTVRDVVDRINGTGESKI